MNMSDKFTVTVARDDRIEETGHFMGLEQLRDNPEIELNFLPGREGNMVSTNELRGADAVISLTDNITENTLSGLDQLKIIGRKGAGYDNLDIDACTERGIVVVHAPGGPTDSVAQATLGMLIACANRFKRRDTMLRKQGAQGKKQHLGKELFGRTFGLIGAGDIGQRVIELVQPLQMDIIVYDPYLDAEVADELGVELVDLDELLETADFVSLHVPLTEETEGMLGTSAFKRMKSSAYLINIARGGIYPDAELAEAIQEGWIEGAAIDVFEDEKLILDNPLLDLPEEEDLLLTPHNVAMTKETLDRLGEILSESIIQFKNGGLPNNILNPEVYDREVPEDKISPAY
jgi:D-3-phosphoglycerate dehydrogenase